MTVRATAGDLFKGRHFDQEIIVLCVRWYLNYKLSSRDLVEMMAERGIALAHSTITKGSVSSNPAPYTRATLTRNGAK
jgi:transposase-like protein